MMNNMQTKTLEIATCLDRDLIFAVNWHGVENDLSQILRTALMGGVLAETGWVR